MNIKNFFQALGDDHSSAMIFKSFRDEFGVVCKKCKSTDHWWIQSMLVYRCRYCYFRTSLRSGTVMEYSKLTYSDWLFTIFYINLSKKPVSAKELQILLGKKHYEPVWTMLHKLRCIMSKSEFGFVKEYENNYVRSCVPFSIGKHQTMNVLISNRPVDTKTYRIDFGDTRSNNKYRPNRNSKGNLSRSYSIDKNQVHMSNIVPYKKLSYWQQIFVSNMKSNIRAVYHHIDDKYLQNYLSEFTFCTNIGMKKGDLFYELLQKCLTTNWYE
jgi:hypothetical protein